MARYRLKVSQHIAPDMTKEPDANGRRPSRVYNAKDIVESDKDLVTLHGAEKFELVRGSVRSAPAKSAPNPSTVEDLGDEDDDTAKADDASEESGRDYDKEYGPLEHLSVKQLKEVAESEEIDLRGSQTKPDIIAAIRKHGGN